jgi:Flp pilus assembly protein CpaB
LLDVGVGTATVDSEGKAVRRQRLGHRLTLAHVAPVALGIVAAVLILAGLKDRSAVQEVAVANHAIPAGQFVTAADVRWVPVHRGDGLVAAGLVGRSELIGAWVASVSIPDGSPIAAAEISPRSAASGLGSMSIQLPPARADGGALKPGDRVDVVSVASGQAVYVASNLLVLAVDRGSGGVLGGVQDSSYYVTVAVDPPTALRIASAQGVSVAGAGAQVELIKLPSEPSGVGVG